jgi:hypothetical protein
MALTNKRVITTSFNYNWTCTKSEQHQDSQHFDSGERLAQAQHRQ